MALVQVTDSAFPGAKSIDFIGQMIVFVEPLGRYWGWSGLTDALAYNALDVAQAETSPDRIVGLCVSNNEVLIFGERTIEPWAFSPTATATFQLRTGSVIESGCGSEGSIKRLDNSVFYLTNNGQVARLNGYTPHVVSTMAIEADIRGCDWSRAFAFTWEDKGHVVYYLTFPDGHTWGYDVRQDKWHRRESFSFNRWRVNALVKSNDKWLTGDFQAGRICEIEWGNTYESCEIMPRKLRTGCLYNASNRVSFHGLRMVAATGQPPIMPATLEDVALLDSRFLGAGPNPAGFYPTTRPFDQFAVVIGTDDANINGTTSNEVHDIAVIGADIYALTSGGGGSASGLYLANRADLTSWTKVATPYQTTPAVRKLTAAGASVFVTCGTKLSKWDGTTLTVTDFGTTLRGVVGDADVVLVIGLYGNVWKSTDGGGTFVVSETFSGWNLYSIAYDGIRFVVAGNIGSLIGFGYSDDGGDTWTRSSFNPGVALNPNEMIWCGPNKWLISSSGNTASNYFFASTDNATTFSAVTLPTNIKYTYYGSMAHDAVSGLTVVMGNDPSNVLRGYSSGDLSGWSNVDLTDTASHSIYTLYPLYSPSAGTDTCTPMESGVFQLRYANDGAENYSNWRDFAPPKVGTFLQPFIARRLGMARHRVWEIMDTSNTPQDVLAASIIME